MWRPRQPAPRARADAALESAALEVVPEAPQRRVLGIERRQLRAGLQMPRLRGTQLLLRALAARELLAVVLREVRAPLALFLLPHQVRDELLEELAPPLPQARN